MVEPSTGDPVKGIVCSSKVEGRLDTTVQRQYSLGGDVKTTFFSDGGYRGGGANPHFLNIFLEAEAG